MDAAHRIMNCELGTMPVSSGSRLRPSRRHLLMMTRLRRRFESHKELGVTAPDTKERMFITTTNMCACTAFAEFFFYSKNSCDCSGIVFLLLALKIHIKSR